MLFGKVFKRLAFTTRKYAYYKKSTVKFSSFNTPQVILPFGVYGSVVRPILFTAGVIGGSTIVAGYVIQQKRKHNWNLRRTVDSFLRPFRLDNLRSSDRLLYLLETIVTIAFDLIQPAVSFGQWRSIYCMAYSEVLSNLIASFLTVLTLCRRVSPMLLSCFSHSGIAHLLVNMFVLYQFLPPVHNALGRERFMVLMLSGGVFSSLASHMFHLVARIPSMSLGFSGALTAILGSFCLIYPNAQLSLFLVPFFTIRAGDAFWLFAALETTLMLFFARRLSVDFASHLGGLVFGYAYTRYLVYGRPPRPLK